MRGTAGLWRSSDQTIMAQFGQADIRSPARRAVLRVATPAGDAAMAMAARLL